ncbi:RnfABCDGE type electron transport complex subunit G [Desulfothermus naphthae]
MNAKEILRMVIVLTVVCGVWGGALSIVKKVTEPQIEYQRIKNIKAPALKKALVVDYDNDPVKDRIKVVVGKDKRGRDIVKNIFLAKKGGKIVAVALEAYGVGYAGNIGVMVSINLPSETIGGIAITTHSETPGVATKATENKKFKDQFKNRLITTNFAPGSGTIDVVSGATYTSRGIMEAVQHAVDIYKKIKSKIGV